ncbi:MAG: dihydrofolate reductase [Paludibacter sp.]|nr:dihydrofolate reductase [uncultured bacterium]MBP8782821.1 dihydrofolate reductase [Paludibacter sp.]
MSEISIVAAVADNYAIGKGNKLPWHLPADLKHFRELTTGHAVVMGKRTFESLPNGPLPNRRNVVLTSVMSEGVNEGYFEADSLEDAFYLCEKEEKVFIVGGAAVYRQSLEIAESLYITWVHHEFSADIYFPEVDFSKWEEVSRQDMSADEKNPYPYSFVHYKRKK